MHLKLFPTLMIDRMRFRSVTLGDLPQPRHISLQPVLPIYKSFRIHCAEPGVGKDAVGIYPMTKERAMFGAPAGLANTSAFSSLPPFLLNDSILFDSGMQSLSDKPHQPSTQNLQLSLS